MDSLLANLTEKITQNLWVLSALFLLVASAYYYYYETKYNYLAKQGIKCIRPIPVFGEFYGMLTQNRLKTPLNRLKEYGRIYGVYVHGKLRLSTSDAEVIRQVGIKDFDVFQNHMTNPYANKYQKAFLVWLTGDKWKKTRALMSPSFTSGKIKRMFNFIGDCADDLIANFNEQLEQQQQGSNLSAANCIVNLKDAYSMYTMDGIATCCYGLKLRRENTGNNLKTAATRDDFVRNATSIAKISPLRLFMAVALPKSFLKLLGFTLTSVDEYVPLLRRVEKLVEQRRLEPKKYDDLLQSLVDARLGDKMELSEMDLKENHHAGLTEETLLRDQEKMIKDLNINNEDGENNNNNNKVVISSKKQLSDFDILTTAAFLLVAGLETTSTLLINCTYALAFHPEIQEKLYNELNKIVEFNEEKNRHLFEYDAITSCQYLDAVISETLRFLSPALATDRYPLRDYYLEKYNLHIPKGSQIHLNIYAAHNDPKYWKNPEIFNPNRFMPGEKENIVPGSYLPFGIGPRHCIGMRFSLTEAKHGLAKVVMKFRFEPAPNSEFPPEPERFSNLTYVKNSVVKLIPRQQQQQH